jgi:NAD(P)H-flavin reductase
VKYATDKQLPLKIFMFDSNRDQRNILYKNEFDEWAAANTNFKVIYTVTDESASTWTGEKGRIDGAMLRRHLDAETLDNSVFYICGPPAMLKAMKQMLEGDLKIPKQRITVEEFTGY